MEILTSATKISLLALVFSLIGLTSFGVVDSGIFEQVIIMVVAFYFGRNTNVPVK